MPYRFKLLETFSKYVKSYAVKSNLKKTLTINLEQHDVSYLITIL